HQRVLRLFDDLVVGVAELGRAVREAEGELEQPLLEHALELEADLHEGGHHVESDAGANSRHLAAVPRGTAELVAGRQLPARIVRVDAELGAVPWDVGVGIEVLHDRLVAEPRDQLRIALLTGPALGPGPLLIGDHVAGVEQRSGGRHGRLLPHGASDAGGITRRARAFKASITWAACVSSGLATRPTASPSSRASTKLGAMAKNGLCAADWANRSRNVPSTTSRMYAVSSATRGRSSGSVREASASSRHASAVGPQ